MPSKNLALAKRRRRRKKLLDDRLSMLRRVVPRNSKMERRSILGDTVDYMKKLLGRIRRLQEEEEEQPTPVSPNETLLTPKFEVERQEAGHTRVEICCAAKPGLLLSTANTLDALGLDIQQCVVSCSGSFSMRAFCSEMRRGMLSTDAIREQLMKNAGYGAAGEEAQPPPTPLPQQQQ